MDRDIRLRNPSHSKRHSERAEKEDELTSKAQDSEMLRTGRADFKIFLGALPESQSLNLGLLYTAMCGCLFQRQVVCLLARVKKKEMAVAARSMAASLYVVPARSGFLQYISRDPIPGPRRRRLKVSKKTVEDVLF